jgi:hypothetical protein
MRGVWICGIIIYLPVSIINERQRVKENFFFLWIPLKAWEKGRSGYRMM